MSVNQEYLRRNLMVAKAIGARENAKTAIARLQKQKRAPRWLLKALEGILYRVEPLPRELADYRNHVPRRATAPQDAGQEEK